MAFALTKVRLSIEIEFFCTIHWPQVVRCGCVKKCLVSCCTSDLTEHTWQEAQLRYGGVGLGSLAQHACAACIASSVSALGAKDTLLHLTTRLVIGSVQPKSRSYFFIRLNVALTECIA